MRTTDEKYMARCIQLAKNGCLNAMPNPMVGAVIVYNDCIIGEGYHICCGQGHAEVNAVKSLRRSALIELRNMQTDNISEEQIENWISAHCKEATIYVSLEPCAHFGKTPPCADLLASKQFKRCVIGCQDPFAKVAGRGIQKLKDAGIEVTVGVLEKECINLNKKFFLFHTKKRPYILLKWAQSADGFMDMERGNAEESPLHISTPNSQMAVHKLRSEYQGILIGSETARLDKPSLTIRSWQGNNPLRIVVDRTGQIQQDETQFKGLRTGTLFVQDLREGFTSLMNADGSETLALDFGQDILPPLLTALHQRTIQSIIVEGGARLLKSFIEQGLWDEIRIETNPSLIVGKGVAAPLLPPHLIRHEAILFDAQITRIYKDES